MGMRSLVGKRSRRPRPRVGIPLAGVTGGERVPVDDGEMMVSR